MAKKKPGFAPNRPTARTAPKRAGVYGEVDDWTRLMLDRADKAFSFDTVQRKRMVDDFRFTHVSGCQWDTYMTRKRANRPNYEFNRTRQIVKRVTGEALRERPTLKAVPTKNTDTSTDTAQIMNGLLASIQNDSSAEIAYDTCYNWSATAGFGAYLVTSEYEYEDSFDQCLKIVDVQDPASTVWWDHTAQKFDRSDARYWFITKMIPRETFEADFPGKEMVEINAPMGEWERWWWEDEMVRIATYWYKEPSKKTIYLLSNGKSVDAAEFDPIKAEAAREGIAIVGEREIKCDKIMCALVNGKGQLEKPTEWGGSMFPIVIQWGDFVVVEGKQVYSGITRFLRDGQMIHNFELSTLVEVVAKQPNSPLMATPKMFEGLESYYERLGYDDPPLLPYNIDPDAPNAKPTREAPAAFSSAFANISAIASDEMKAVSGIFDASTGAAGNETSGRAILARQSQGSIANMSYVANRDKAMAQLGKVLVDAIPHYYDADRVVKILDDQGAEKYIRINQPMVDEQTGEVHTINDLTAGRYEVKVVPGKSFETAMLELGDVGQALAQGEGPMALLGQYLMLRSAAIPGTDDILKGMRGELVKQGLLPPADGEEPPKPPEPNPKDVAQAKKDLTAGMLNMATVKKTMAQTREIEAKTHEILATLPANVEIAENEAAAGVPAPSFMDFPTTTQ